MFLISYRVTLLVNSHEEGLSRPSWRVLVSPFLTRKHWTSREKKLAGYKHSNLLWRRKSVLYGWP